MTRLVRTWRRVPVHANEPAVTDVHCEEAEWVASRDLVNEKARALKRQSSEGLVMSLAHGEGGGQLGGQLSPVESRKERKKKQDRRTRVLDITDKCTICSGKTPRILFT